MTIPGFQTIMLPLLRIASDGQVHNLHDAANQLANHFSLSEDELSELISSGQPKFYNRVGWARTYLKKSGLIDYPKRGSFQITEMGQNVLLENPPKISMKYLERFPEYLEFREKTKGPEDRDSNDDPNGVLTPLEALENAYQKIRADLADELLDTVLSASPGFFERLVVELLVKMGYGGSQRNAARVIGKSGDEGIDGTIDEDRLGLDTIYIQAKRWKKEITIGRPEIQKFVGALLGKKAKKGVFITTACFTNEALDFVRNIDAKVVLIDGSKLSDLMIDFGVGVTTRVQYEIKELDSDFFGEGLGG